MSKKCNYVIIFSGILLQIIYLFSPFVNTTKSKPLLSLLILGFFPLLIYQAIGIGTKVFGQQKSKLLAFLIAFNPLFISLIIRSPLLAFGAIFFLMFLNTYFSYLDKRNQKKLLISICLFLVSIVILFIQIYQSKTLFPFIKDPGVINAINASRGTEIKNNNPLLGKVLYNKSFYIFYWLKLYLKQFSLDNLFGLAESISSTHSLNTLPLLLVYVPFFVSGLFNSFKELPKSKAKFLFISLLVTGILSSFTRYTPLFLAYLIIIVLIYTGLGIARLINNRTKRIIFTLFFMINFLISYLHLYVGLNY